LHCPTSQSQREKPDFLIIQLQIVPHHYKKYGFAEKTRLEDEEESVHPCFGFIGSKAGF
jgi:hypothetical protein